MLMNEENDGRAIRLSHNIFNGNYASFGKIISSRGFSGYIDMSWGYYDVYHQVPGSRNDVKMSSYWCFSDEGVMDFTNSSGEEEAIYNPDGKIIIDSRRCSNEPCRDGDDIIYSSIETSISEIYADATHLVDIQISKIL